MKPMQIIENLITRLAQSTGRHLYGVLGTYSQLTEFETVLADARTRDGRRFPQPVNVNRGILDTIPDDEFFTLVENEAKRPEPTAAHVAKAFECFLRGSLGEYREKQRGVLILSHLELLFAYNLELNLLRTLAADEDRILLLLPGKRTGGGALMFHGLTAGSYLLPTNFIAENHLWEIS